MMVASARDYAAAEVTGIGLPTFEFAEPDPELSPPDFTRWLAAAYFGLAKAVRREGIIRVAKAGCPPSADDRAFLSANGWGGRLPVTDFERALRVVEQGGGAEADQSVSKA